MSLFDKVRGSYARLGNLARAGVLLTATSPFWLFGLNCSSADENSPADGLPVPEYPADLDEGVKDMLDWGVADWDYGHAIEHLAWPVLRTLSGLESGALELQIADTEGGFAATVPDAEFELDDAAMRHAVASADYDGDRHVSRAEAEEALKRYIFSRRLAGRFTAVAPQTRPAEQGELEAVDEEGVEPVQFPEDIQQLVDDGLAVVKYGFAVDNEALVYVNRIAAVRSGMIGVDVENRTIDTDTFPDALEPDLFEAALREADTDQDNHLTEAEALEWYGRSLDELIEAESAPVAGPFSDEVQQMLDNGEAVEKFGYAVSARGLVGLRRIAAYLAGNTEFDYGRRSFPEGEYDEEARPEILRGVIEEAAGDDNFVSFEEAREWYRAQASWVAEHTSRYSEDVRAMLESGEAVEKFGYAVSARGLVGLRRIAAYRAGNTEFDYERRSFPEGEYDEEAEPGILRELVEEAAGDDNFVSMAEVRRLYTAESHRLYDAYRSPEEPE